MLFEGIIGQGLATRMLESRVKSNRLPSTLLFYGPDGVGKRTVALVLARILNCRETEHGYCGGCGSCKAIGDLTHPNLRIIFPVKRAGDIKGLPEPDLYDEQGTISIDMVRLLRKEASLRPYQEGKRIFVVLDANRMKEEAQNAFLKLLEEPPDDTMIILTTSRADALSPTILSRCQKVRFSRLPLTDIENSLVKRLGAARPKARLVASLSGGSLGRAEGMLEVFAEQHRESIFQFVLEGPRGDDLDIMDFAQGLVNDGLVHETLEVFQSIYRDILVLKMGASDTVVNTDHDEDLGRTAVGMTWEEIHGTILAVEEASRHLARNVNPKLVLFNLLSRMVDRSRTRV
jgi:DNA polymerase-3 subunit delta'